MISDTNLHDINVIGKKMSIVRADIDARTRIQRAYIHDQSIYIICPLRTLINIQLDTKIDEFDINITEKDYDFIYKTHDLNILSLYIINLIKKNNK